MTVLKKLIILVVLCVVLPLTAMAAIEGTASAGLLLTSLRARTSPGNFRQATYDSLVGWVSIKNMSKPDAFGPGLTTTTNADGMRIHRPVEALAAGQRRVICSGDSFTFGSGVGDSSTFCAQLENELPNVRTLNMAQPGYGIDQAYLWYKRDAKKYPHQVHLFAFIWHDFERMALTSFFDYPKPKLSLDHDTVVVNNVPVPQWKGPSRWTQASTTFGQVRMVQFVRERMDLSDSVKLARVDAQVWDIAEGVFKDLKKVNEANGSKLVLVYLPAPPDLSAGAYDHRRERLAAFASKNGIALIDLTPEMRKVPTDTLDWMFITPNALPVNGSSGHYTELGHKWVARELASSLRTLGIFGADTSSNAVSKPQ